MWNNFTYICIFNGELFPHALNDRAGPGSGVRSIFEFMGWDPAGKPRCNPISYLIRSVNLKWRSNNPVQARVKAPWWETVWKKQVFFYFFFVRWVSSGCSLCAAMCCLLVSHGGSLHVPERLIWAGAWHGRWVGSWHGHVGPNSGLSKTHSFNPD